MGNNIAVQVEDLHVLQTRPEKQNLKRFKFVVNGQTVRNVETIKKIGEGGVGSVYLVLDVTKKQQYALKVIDRNLNDNRVYQVWEALNLIRAASKSRPLSKIYEAYHYKSQYEQCLYIFMVNYSLYVLTRKHYYKHGGLEKYLEQMKHAGTPIKQDTIQQIAKNIFKALNTLHSAKPRPIIHRDVSIDNILINKIDANSGYIDVVLNDFDTARDISEESLMTMYIGKSNYWAPEVMSGNYSTSADVWSAGVLLFELMTTTRTSKIRSIRDENTAEQVHEFMRKEMNKAGIYSNDMIEIIIRMVTFDASKRPTAAFLYHHFSNNKEGMVLAACEAYDIPYITRTLERCVEMSNQVFAYACQHNDMYLLEVATRTGFATDVVNATQQQTLSRIYNLNLGLYAACKGGQFSMIEYLVQKGANNWDLGMIAGGEYGRMDIVQLMIKYGAKDWNRGLSSACTGGNIEIVKLMIERGADNWKGGMLSACIGGHTQVVELMLQKGANNLRTCMTHACKGGHLKVVQLLMTKGVTNWNEGFRYACFGGHTEIIYLMIKQGANDWNGGLLEACEGGQPEVVEFMLEKGANSIGESICKACLYKQYDVLDVMIHSGCNLNLGLLYACKWGWKDVIEKVLEKGADDINGALSVVEESTAYDEKRKIIDLLESFR
jgi:serine/threonine protein kinase